MPKQHRYLIEIVDGGRIDRRAVHPAASRLRAQYRQPHSGLGPVRYRFRYSVRLYRIAVVRPVGVLRHRRLRRRLSADPRRISERVPGADHRHDLGRRGRISGRIDRAAAHRHLFRHDHGGDRGGVLLRRVQSARRVYRRRKRPAGRADPEFQSRFHHAAFHHRLVALPVPGGVLFRRHRDRAAHRALAGRRGPERDPRQSAARAGGRTQRPWLQADRLRDRGGLCRFCRRSARRVAGVHAAGRLHLRDLRPARDADRDRRHRHPVRAAAGRRRLAVSAGLPAIRARARRGLEARARHRVRSAGDVPAARHHRRLQGSV